MRRHHLLIFAVVGILLVLAIFVIVGWVSGGDAGDQEDQPPAGTLTSVTFLVS